MSSDLIDRFYETFRGRNDALGTWEGGAQRVQVTREHFEKHLTSTDPKDWIGVYMLGKNMCAWGCIDLDGKDFPTETAGEWDWDRMAELAYNLCVVLRVKNVHAHTERTKNGIHIWVFPEARVVPAAVMRNALLAACAALDYKPKEVNPKQSSLGDNQLGNYVRLPYYGALTNMHEGGWQRDRHFFDWDDVDGCHPHGVGSYMSLEYFLDHVKPTATADLEAVAQLYKPPTVHHSVNTEAGLEASHILPRVDALAYTIWRDGPLPGSDRSSTLAHLAHLCREAGISTTEAYVVVASADARWGKFQPEGRADAEQQLTAIVERAYAS